MCRKLRVIKNYKIISYESYLIKLFYLPQLCDDYLPLTEAKDKRHKQNETPRKRRSLAYLLKSLCIHPGFYEVSPSYSDGPQDVSRFE